MEESQMSNNLPIGQIISELRRAKGSTQEELANAVKVSAQAVSKWENGGTPDTELIPSIADYFGVSIDKLFGRNVSPNICETVHDYVSEPGQFKGFGRAFNIYCSLHGGLTGPAMHKFDQNNLLAYHNSDENGYSLMVSNGYGDLVKREYWEAVNLETASFSRELFSLLAEPGILEVLFALLRRKVFGPANFEMIKTALVNAKYADEEIQECLNKLIERKISAIEDSPYDEIGKTYQIDDMWYLGLCAVICAAQALKISLPGISCFLGRGAWPINL
jgi:transcriptional regulator with XRE-family HTH domain